MSLHAEAVKALAGWTPPDEEQQALRGLFVAHLREHPDGLSRACRPGHITASTAVLDPPRRRVLLTLHSKLGGWLQLGGHCEPTDATLAAAAVREACEESAIAGLALLDGPVGLDLHCVPCGRPRYAGGPHGPVSGVDATSQAEAVRLAGAPGPAAPADRLRALERAGRAGWTWHLDVQFVAISPPGAHPIRGGDSDEVRWWPVDSLPVSADDAVHRLVERARGLSL